MSDLLTLKNRLRTIQSLDSVMNAMLVITAAKNQRIKMKYLHAQKYADRMKLIAEQVCGGLKEKTRDKALIIVFSTNKGLCGSFNENLLRAVNAHIKTSGKNNELFLFGKYASKLECGNNVYSRDNDLVRARTGKKIAAAAELVVKWHFENKGEVYAAYNGYKSILIQKPKIEKILPLDVSQDGFSLVEPGVEELYAPLLSHYIESTLNKCLIESELGELSSRMFVVKGATDNSRGMLSDLKIAINKARQAKITSELAEIVSSFEALKEGEE